MFSLEIQTLIKHLSKLPGLGPRSGRRAALYLIKKRSEFLKPLAEALLSVHAAIKTCTLCHNLDTKDPCSLCEDPKRDTSLLCVVEEVSDLWAIERTDSFKGRYHVLGGVLSALDGITPEDLMIASLLKRIENSLKTEQPIQEVIIALNATLEGQTTAHYLMDALSKYPITVSRLAHGVPMGGELDYLDEGTLSLALKSRRPL